jgi:hypothetical protein
MWCICRWCWRRTRASKVVFGLILGKLFVVAVWPVEVGRYGTELNTHTGDASLTARRRERGALVAGQWCSPENGGAGANQRRRVSRLCGCEQGSGPAGTGGSRQAWSYVASKTCPDAHWQGHGNTCIPTSLHTQAV